MPENQLTARLEYLEKSCLAIADNLRQIMGDISSIREAIDAIAKKQIVAENVLQRIDQFDALMRGAKDTQVKLAEQISSILENQQSNGEKIMQRFDKYETGSEKVRETQRKIAAEISQIAAHVHKES